MGLLVAYLMVGYGLNEKLLGLKIILYVFGHSCPVETTIGTGIKYS